MDHRQLSELARKIAALDEAGWLDRVRDVIRERLGHEGGYHDGTRWLELRRTEAGRNQMDLEFHLANTVDLSLPLAGQLEELLDVPRDQAIAVALEQQGVEWRRTVAIEVIERAYALLRQKNAAQRRLPKRRSA
jgi:hypothetical protein